MTEEDCRDKALSNLSSCCGNSSDRDEVLYYIEVLESILVHVVGGEALTQNQKDIYDIVMKRKDVFI